MVQYLADYKLLQRAEVGHLHPFNIHNRTHGLVPEAYIYKSIFPCKANICWSYVRGTLSAIFKSLFFNLAATATKWKSSPPIIVMSASVSITPVAGTPGINTSANCGLNLLPLSMIRTTLTSESDEYNKDNGSIMVFSIGLLDIGESVIFLSIDGCKLLDLTCLALHFFLTRPSLICNHVHIAWLSGSNNTSGCKQAFISVLTV